METRALFRTAAPPAVTQRRWNLRVRLEICVESLQSADAATFGLEDVNRVLDLLHNTELPDVGNEFYLNSNSCPVVPTIRSFIGEQGYDNTGILAVG